LAVTAGAAAHHQRRRAGGPVRPLSGLKPGSLPPLPTFWPELRQGGWDSAMHACDIPRLYLCRSS